MSFDVGAATFDSAEPHSRHRIATSTSATHAYLFDLWDSPPAWFDVPATDLQPELARLFVDAAEAGQPTIAAVVARCQSSMTKLLQKKETLYAGSGAVGAFATFPAADQIAIGWIGNARVYRMSVAGAVTLVSQDHSLLNDYLRHRPDLTEAQIAELPRDVITRSIGMMVEADHSAVRPDVMSCSLEPGEWLILAPKGAVESVLNDAKLRKAPTAAAAARLITALAIAQEPNLCTGAIVIRRLSEDEVALSTRDAHWQIKKLIAACPDVESESVLADWCEEHERSELLPWLRHTSGDVRLCAARHLRATLAKDVGADAIASGSHLALALGKARWHRLASALRVSNRESRTPPLVHLASAIDLEDEDVTAVTWALARELVEVVPAHFADRVRPFADMVTTACPACGRLAFIVAESDAEHDDIGQLEWTTRAYALCLYELHCMLIGMSDTDGLPTARK